MAKDSSDIRADLASLLLAHAEDAKKLLTWSSTPKGSIDARLFEALLGEKDRGCVLAAISYLDEKLRDRIRERLIELSNPTAKDLQMLLQDGAQGPIGTFYVRVLMARSLGVIDESTRCALDGVRGLRNKAAHSWYDFAFTKNNLKPIQSAFSKPLWAWITEGAVLIDRCLDAHFTAMGPVAMFFDRPSQQRLQFVWTIVVLLNQLLADQKSGLSA